RRPEDRSSPALPPGLGLLPRRSKSPHRPARSQPALQLPRTLHCRPEERLRHRAAADHRSRSPAPDRLAAFFPEPLVTFSAMELRHLRYFLAVGEASSFTKAAARLGIAQPALSRQVQDLEDEIGVDLLRRSPRGVVLTAEGKLFL